MLTQSKLKEKKAIVRLTLASERDKGLFRWDRQRIAKYILAHDGPFKKA